jgi:hypothetical protein
VITGFNTDVEHDGVIYHVQTEDKGLESPLILSLVYSGGAILASKRSTYEDLIAAGFDEEVLADRLKRQHRLICAAIRAGRIDDLKRMGGREPEREADEALQATTEEEESGAEVSASDVEAPLDQDAAPPEELPKKKGARRKSTGPAAYSIYDPRRQSPLGETTDSETGLRVSLLDEHDFCAGESVVLRILVGYQSGENLRPKAGVAVSVKVLGTTFRPQIHALKTERDGVAVLSARLPEFTSGRAAILVRVASEGKAVELRRVIHPGR